MSDGMTDRRSQTERLLTATEEERLKDRMKDRILHALIGVSAIGDLKISQVREITNLITFEMMQELGKITR